MNGFNNTNIFSKKNKKRLLFIVLFSLINNFIIFPAQAAMSEDARIEILSNASQRLVIKSPTSKINHFEELISVEPTSKSNKGISFELITDTNKPATPKKDSPAFKIASLDETTDASNGQVRLVSMTAYTSEVGQTDSDPCTTANGFNLCVHGAEDSVAANFLPFGTKIMVPDLFPGRVFIVRDRMNHRYQNRVDFWFVNKGEALKFGIHQAQIVILPN